MSVHLHVTPDLTAITEIEKRTYAQTSLILKVLLQCLADHIPV